ncbi:hypothetical protein BaRGS_00003555 [Batillaria attramentaria]|uniref:Alpha-type protein kinase domain-containing protein n=1 Tax=Batillaria attramentaria TaxID=370345 RepID=A0ABD0M1X4_9CAEN
MPPGIFNQKRLTLPSPINMSVRLFHLKNETNSSCPDLKGQNYRASFHTRSSAKGPRKKIYRAHLEGDGPRKGEHAVVKVFRQAPGTEAMCDAEMSKHVLARKLARKFNKMVPDVSDKGESSQFPKYFKILPHVLIFREASPGDRIRRSHIIMDNVIAFTMPLKSTVDKVGMGNYLFHHSRQLDKCEWVLIEENLVVDQQYQLFLRKNGDRAGKDPTSLDAFVHFTYLESGQKYVLCGFQGVYSDDAGYKLTTPCIHSLDQRFGPTDKGLNGIQTAFSKHKCNNLCYNWPKPDEVDENEAERMEVSSENESGDDSRSSDECEGAISTDSTVAFGMDHLNDHNVSDEDSEKSSADSVDGKSPNGSLVNGGASAKSNRKFVTGEKANAGFVNGEN